MSEEKNPVAILCSAAAGIVNQAREHLYGQDHYTKELRIPVIIGGTDMRVTIEAGPKVAARNAIEQAQISSSGKLPMISDASDVPSTLARAIVLLSQYAIDIKDSATNGSGGWTPDVHSEKTWHDQCLSTILELKNVERLF